VASRIICQPENGLYGVISQKMIRFITTAVETTNPTYLNHIHFHDSLDSQARKIDKTKSPLWAYFGFDSQ
jgi:hypothetical protein